MKNLKHTTGPWTIKGYAGQHDEAGALIVAGEKHICSTSGGLRENSPQKDWQEYYANAQLIKSAPDMLNALLLDNCFPTTTVEQQEEAEELGVKLGWKKDMPLENFAQQLRRIAIKSATKNHV